MTYQDFKKSGEKKQEKKEEPVITQMEAEYTNRKIANLNLLGNICVIILVILSLCLGIYCIFKSFGAKLPL